MKTPPRTDIVALLVQGLSDWARHDDPAYTQQRIEGLADSLTNYFAIYHMTQGGDLPLPGLPGGAALR